MRRFVLARWRSLFAAAFVALMLGPTMSAQTDVTTSRISGTVRDGIGVPLPGVTIEAKNLETGLVKVATTRRDGSYTLVDLPTGRYSVTASFEGFQTVTRPDIRLILGSAPTVDFQLQLSTVKEAITVTSAIPVIEVTNTSESTTIQTEQLKALPINGRNFTQLVNLTPNAKTETQRGYIQISGQRGINTNVTVDGVDYNDAFFGGPVGSAEGRAPLSLSEESIKEFTVITDGASVEFGRSGGGFVNVITKSGTNTFHGSGFYLWQPQDLIAKFPNGQAPADQSKKQYGGSLGGPALKDRLFFFLSGDNQNQDVTIPINQAVLDPDILAKYPALDSAPQYVQTTDGYVLFGRVDFAVSPQHRLMVRGNYANYSGENGTSSSANRTASTNGLEGLKSRSYVATYSAQFTPSLLNDLNGNWVIEDIPRADKNLNLPEIDFGAFTYGEVSFLPIVSKSERKAAGDTVTYLLKDHVLKAGGEYNDTSINQIFKGNWRGTFVFNTKADFLAGRWSQYRQFGGQGGLTADEAGAATFGQKEIALFAQDQWFVTPNLTVTVGVRWEGLNNPDFATLNPNDSNTGLCTNPADTTTCAFNLSARIPDDNSQWSPRLAASWSPDKLSVVRFTLGRYWSRTPNLLWAQANTSNGYRATQTTIFAQTGSGGVVTGPPTDPLCSVTACPGWGDAFDPVGVARIDFSKVSAAPRPGVFVVDPDFQNPYTDRVSLGFEREVFSKTTAGLEVAYSRSRHLERLTDINREYDGTTSTNGLPHYSTKVFPFPFYGRITEYKSDGSSKFYSITANLNRRFAENLTANVSATYSRDKDDDSNERNFSGIQAEDYNNLGLNYGFADRDRRWTVAANAVWNTPWYGIGIAGSFRYLTGLPFNATINADVNGDGVSSTDRPTVDGAHFDRNSFRQPDQYSLDIRLSKAFSVGPVQISVLADCYNCTNHANRFINNTVWGPNQTANANFGLETGFPTGVGAIPPRTFQFGARVDF
jgi:hypothetical protein